MYLEDYVWFLIATAFCMIVAFFANYKVNSTFAKHNKVFTRSNMTGYDTANLLLKNNGVYDVAVGEIRGSLTDHYNPKASVINLSESTYENKSISAVAVAAHEVGHVMQKKSGYFLYKVRTAIVPIVNFGSRLAMPLVLIGLIIELFVETVNPDVGFYVALVGVILYGGSLLFALVTLPVELNASKRAKKMLIQNGVLTSEELDGASEVLSAAAFTYFVSLLTSIVYFLRFLVRVLTIFGRRNNR